MTQVYWNYHHGKNCNIAKYYTYWANFPGYLPGDNISSNNLWNRNSIKLNYIYRGCCLILMMLTNSASKHLVWNITLLYISHYYTEISYYYTVELIVLIELYWNCTSISCISEEKSTAHSETNKYMTEHSSVNIDCNHETM